MSKIMILNGSPRKKGNTSALTAAFTKGAESTGHTVVLASPLYYCNPQKSAVLLMAAEGHGFEDCVSYYDHLMGASL